MTNKLCHFYPDKVNNLLNVWRIEIPDIYEGMRWCYLVDILGTKMYWDGGVVEWSVQFF